MNISIGHDIEIDAQGSADKILSELSPVAADKARVVLYMERVAKGEGLGGIGPIRGLGLTAVLIKGEQGSTKVSMLDQTAEVIDLPAGKYAIETPKGGVFGNDDRSLSIVVKNGQTYFLKIEGNKPPKLVPTDEAREEIRQADIRCDTHEGSIFALQTQTNAKYGPYSSQMSHKELISLTMQFNPSPDRSRIYIMGGTSGFFGPMLIGLDCKADRRIKKNTFLCYDVAPGNHAVTVGHAINKNLESAYSINTVGGKCYFFDFIWGEGNKSFIREEKGKKRLKKCKLQKNGFLKSVP
jgi:hypothetical protein